MCPALQANECITLPFKVQSFEPPDGYLNPHLSPESLHTAAATKGEGAGGKDTDKGPPGRDVTVEVVSVAHDHPVLVLELRIAPKPLIIDRTFRWVHVNPGYRPDVNPDP